MRLSKISLTENPDSSGSKIRGLIFSVDPSLSYNFSGISVCLLILFPLRGGKKLHRKIKFLFKENLNNSTRRLRLTNLMQKKMERELQKMKIRIISIFYSFCSRCIYAGGQFFHNRRKRIVSSGHDKYAHRSADNGCASSFRFFSHDLLFLWT